MSTDTSNTSTEITCTNCHEPIRQAPNAWGWVHVEGSTIECMHITHRAQVASPWLVGISELAALTDQSVLTVSQQHHRGQLPAPATTLRAGPVWFGNDPAVRAWITRRGEVSDFRRLLEAMVAAGEIEGDEDPAKTAARLAKVTTADQFAQERGWCRGYPGRGVGQPQAWKRIEG